MPRGRAFGGHGFRTRAAKRLTTWVGSADTGGSVIAAGTKVILQSNATLGDTTIVRVRGMLDPRPNVFSQDIDVVGAFGMGIVSDQAFAAGVASVPGPFTDPDFDWFVWMGFSWRSEFTTDIGRLIGSVPQVIDSKAMRKVNQNQTVVIVAEGQGDALFVNAVFRMLVKLP